MFLCAERNYLFAGRGAGPVVELTSLIIRSFRVAEAALISYHDEWFHREFVCCDYFGFQAYHPAIIC
jgi:hypothetical protein